MPARVFSLLGWLWSKDCSPLETASTKISSACLWRCIITPPPCLSACNNPPPCLCACNDPISLLNYIISALSFWDAEASPSQKRFSCVTFFFISLQPQSGKVPRVPQDMATQFLSDRIENQPHRENIGVISQDIHSLSSCEVRKTDSHSYLVPLGPSEGAVLYLKPTQNCLPVFLSGSGCKDQWSSRKHKARNPDYNRVGW